jgi:hypothetical protein
VHLDISPVMNSIGGSFALNRYTEYTGFITGEYADAGILVECV